MLRRVRKAGSVGFTSKADCLPALLEDPMQLFSSTCLAIANANFKGTLWLEEKEGRFGSYFIIGDEHGMIEVAHTLQDAENRILSVKNKSTH